MKNKSDKQNVVIKNFNLRYYEIYLKTMEVIIYRVSLNENVLNNPQDFHACSCRKIKK